MVHLFLPDDRHKQLDELALAYSILAPYLPVRLLQLLGCWLEHIADTSFVYLAFQFLEVYHKRNSLGCGHVEGLEPLAHLGFLCHATKNGNVRGLHDLFRTAGCTIYQLSHAFGPMRVPTRTLTSLR